MAEALFSSSNSTVLGTGGGAGVKTIAEGLKSEVTGPKSEVGPIRRSEQRSRQQHIPAQGWAALVIHPVPAKKLQILVAEGTREKHAKPRRARRGHAARPHMQALSVC